MEEGLGEILSLLVTNIHLKAPVQLKKDKLKKQTSDFDHVLADGLQLGGLCK